MVCTQDKTICRPAASVCIFWLTWAPSVPILQSLKHQLVHQASYELILLFQSSSESCVFVYSSSTSACDPISSLKVTSLHSSPTHLLVGTNTGVVLTVPLPFIEPSLEPHPLPHPPTPTPLYHGHVDSVHFSLVLQKEGRPLIITGGNGHQNFNKNVSQNSHIPDTANLLLWR